MFYKISFITLAVLLSTYVCAYASEDAELIKSVNELRESVKPENNEYSMEITDVYEAMKKAEPVEVSIPSYDIFKDAQKNIMADLNLPEPDALVPDPSCVDPEKLGDYRAFVFISESVPEITLKNYMKDAAKLGNVLLVMRGVIGTADFLKPTLNFMTRISCDKDYAELKVDDDCSISRVDINPLLFTLFKIDRVPAIVYSRLSYHELMIKANTGDPLKDEDYFLIRGDMPVSYAFERFEKAGADTTDYLKALKGSYGG